MEQMLYPIWPDAARSLGLGRTKTHQLVASGELRTVTIGRRRLVPRAALEEFVRRLETSAA